MEDATEILEILLPERVIEAKVHADSLEEDWGQPGRHSSAAGSPGATKYATKIRDQVTHRVTTP